MRPLRLLFLEHEPRFAGGSERFSLDLCRHAIGRGHRASLAFADAGDMVPAYLAAGAICHKLPLHSVAVREPLATWRAFRSLVRTMWADEVDLVFTSQIAYSSLIVAAARVTGARSAVHLGLVVDYESPVFRLAMRGVTLGIAPSAHTFDGWSALGWPRRSLRTIANGIDVSRFDRSMSRDEARRKMNFAPGVPLIAYVGRLVAAKGIFTLMHAFADLLRAGGEGHLMFVGSAAGAEREQLRAQAAREGLPSDRWTIQSSTDTPELIYRAADLVVLPAEWDEPFGLVPLEAAACGTMVVVSDRGLLPELVRAAGDLAVFPSGDAGALCQRLDHWLRRPSEREAAAERLYADVRERFSFDRCGDAYLAEFASVVTA